MLFLTFNRLEQSAKVFERIRAVKPPKLYFASDGPRRNSPDEKSKVFSVRDYVLSQIDWNCDVKTLLRDDNLGCKQAVAGAIDWFFKCEEQGLILEDDCLPSLSFFDFAMNCSKNINMIPV